MRSERDVTSSKRRPASDMSLSAGSAMCRRLAQLITLCDAAVLSLRSEISIFSSGLEKSSKRPLHAHADQLSTRARSRSLRLATRSGRRSMFDSLRCI